MKLKSILTLLLMSVATLSAKNALPELKDSEIPQTFQELWQDIDPRAEPLEPEILKEWEEDGAVIQILKINVAKVGDKYLKVVGVYGYPKGAKNLPALVQMHGGGQSAHANNIIVNAKRGYATFAVAWTGRIISSQYNVKAGNLKAFWDNDTANKNYMISTDWLHIDAYHAPARWGRSPLAVGASEHTLDKVDSPRNVMWFLWTLAGQRALTFLEQQPQVDPNKLGVYGHSMGGKLTTLIAGSDDRIKAAVPSCGGVNTNPSKYKLYNDTMDDINYLKNMKAPILFLAPANDFHGHIDDTAVAVDEVQTKDWRIVATPHKSHKDEPKAWTSTLLFMDTHLKGTFKFPASPKLTLDTKGEKAVVSLSVDAYNIENLKEVDLFYSLQGDRKDRDLNKMRFWHYAKLEKNKDGEYVGDLPVFSKNKDLWLYANLTYDLKKNYSFTDYGYKMGEADELLLSSQLLMFKPEDFANTKLKDSTPSPILLDGANSNWQKEFFVNDPLSWNFTTYKVSDEHYAPTNELLIEVEAKQDTGFVISLDDYAKEIELKASDKVQSFKLKAQDFQNANGEPLESFKTFNSLKLIPEIRIQWEKNKVKKQLKLGDKQKYNLIPSFKLIKWI